MKLCSFLGMKSRSRALAISGIPASCAVSGVGWPKAESGADESQREGGNSLRTEWYQIAPQFEILVWILGIILLLFVLCMIARMILGRRGTDDDPLVVSDPKAIREILDQAADRQSRFEIRIQHGMLIDKLLSSQVVAVNRTRLTIELPANIRPGKALVGLGVEAYVTGSGTQGKTFYSFPATILSVEKTEHKAARLDLSMPSLLQRFSRRSALRTEVPDGFFVGLMVWVPEDSTLPESFTPEALGTPAQAWRAEDALPGKPPVRLLDLSGNGLRLGGLSIPTAGRDLVAEKQMLIVHLDLKDPSGGEPTSHWLACEVRNENRLQQGLLDVGLRIVAYGEEEIDAFQWRRLPTGEEVPVLGEWVFRYHLIAHRQAKAEEQKRET